MAYKVPEKEENKALTEEEQIAQVDQIMAMSKLFPTADPWGQRVDTLGGSSMVNCLSP
jgi:protein MBA1